MQITHARQSVVSPFFSIIIPTFNSARTIEAALKSVASQDSDDFEVIVSDGVSTDQTLAAVSRYSDRLGTVTVLSRPDRGVYDAINRAIAVVRGSWVHVLGSDDCLHAPNVLSRFQSELASALEPIVYGDVVIRGESSLAADGERYGGEFTMQRLFRQNICQQAIFYRRELFDRIGGFEPRYRIWGDWHFALRALARYPARWVDIVVCEIAAGGLSSTQTDRAFEDDYPKMLVRLLAAAPMRPEFRTAMRWILYQRALADRDDGRVLRSAMFYVASAWLGVQERLRARVG